MTSILVLGATGMLGSMVDLYLRTLDDHNVISTHRGNDGHNKDHIYFDVENGIGKLNDIVKNEGVDYIINCIGIIKPHCKDDDPVGKKNAILVNSLFPHEMSKIAGKNGCRVIQIATDCVFSGKDGKYVESSIHDPLDVYGKSKSLGEVYDGNVLNLRTSIIGPELKGKLSLLEWFLEQPDGAVLKGFSHHRWNGMTTLQFAQLCDHVIRESLFDDLIERSMIWHCVRNSEVDKFQLLKVIAKIFQKDFTIEKVDNIGPPVDRTLSTEIDHWPYHNRMDTIENSLSEMRTFMKKEGFYSEK